MSLDLSQLKEKLHDILPGEDIRVVATRDTLTLYGEVSSPMKLSQAVELARAFVPDKIMNLLQVGGVQQVMLEVRVAEMSRSLTRRLGFNFNVLTNGAAFGVSQLSGLTTSSNPSGITSDLTTTLSAAVNALFRFHTGNITFSGFIDALKENGLVKILAEPTLMTLSGQEARFLAGGEFPIPIAQRADTITIEFKTFGVGLVFTPTVLGEDKISLRVAPEVSELDFSNAVSFAGFRIPALTSRRASTVIELASGQSFAIAGLLQESVREAVSKYPVLGDIPILGALFRRRTEVDTPRYLLIFVTATILTDSGEFLVLDENPRETKPDSRAK